MNAKTAIPLFFLALIPLNSAFAGVSVFDFRNSFGVQTNVEGTAFTPVSGTAGLTVTPFGNLIGGTSTQNANADAIQGDWGLGVLNKNVPVGDDVGIYGGRVHVDGSNSPEFLRLEFSDKVKITQVSFAYVGGFEKFGLAVDGVKIDVAALFGTDELLKLGAPNVAFPADSLPWGKTWDFFAANPIDEWNIEGVEVIPEPTTFLIWSGLAMTGVGLGWRKRRQRKRADRSHAEKLQD